jgi:hypothetical protein
MVTRRGSKIKCLVTLAGAQKYGFSTQQKIIDAYGEMAGIVAYANQTGVFFGANAPKPARAVWINSSGNESVFCSHDKIASLRVKNNVLIKQNTKIRSLHTTGKVRTVYVPMPGGWKYAWNLPSAEYAYADILGLKTPTGSDIDSLVWGVNNPKPPRAMTLKSGSRYSTYINPTQEILDAAAAAGWSISGVTDLNDSGIA